MIIKSHIRGGYRAAADYLKEQGKNEYTRLVEISDPSARNLDDAFHNMWVVAGNTRCTKPLHHISINPMKDERLTDKQVMAIVERCEEKYGYKQFYHQRVIVEHIKDGRQHFHVIWNRVSLTTGKPVWPGHHWKKSKQVCREMEKELGLKRPMPNRTKRALNHLIRTGRVTKSGNRYHLVREPGRKHAPSIGGQINKGFVFKPPALGSGPVRPFRLPVTKSSYATPPMRPTSALPVMPVRRGRRGKKDENIPDGEKMPFMRPREWTTAELIAWAWENGRWDILAQFGIHVSADYFEP